MTGGDKPIASDGSEAAADGDLGTVTDEEWRAAHEAMPALLDADGCEVGPGPYVWAPGIPAEQAVVQVCDVDADQ